jgi:MraZ protein
MGVSGEQWELRRVRVQSKRLKRLVRDGAPKWCVRTSCKNTNACQALKDKVTFLATSNYVMFIGEFHHTLDEKGRLAVPVKFRAELASGAVVTRGLDRSLFLYPKSVWETLAAKLAALPIGQADTRAFARLMLSGAMEVELDKAGRVTVPEVLRSYAGLSKSVVVTGLYDRLEIWDETSWAEYAAKTEQDSNAIAERLGSIV